MPGYLFMNADVTDPEGYEEYKSEVVAVLARFGGRFLVRGGRTAALEGRWHPRCVLIEFPSYEDAVAFYDSDDYRAIRGIRHRTTESALLVMDGLPPS